jgi:phage terminase large subunit GpA-like protein
LPISACCVGSGYSRGTQIREWCRKKSVRGEALDWRTYAFAGLQALIATGLSLERECERIEMLAAKVAELQPPRVSRSRWMQT